MADPLPSGNAFWTFIEHPRTNILGALILTGIGIFSPHVVAYILWLVALVLALRSAYEWEPVRTRIPFEIQSPIVGKGPAPAKPLPPELGRIDFELYLTKAGAETNRLLVRMTGEIARNTANVTKSSARLQTLQGADVGKRHRALRTSGRMLSAYARRLGRMEARYRIALVGMTSNSQKWLASTSPDEDLSEFVETVAVTRTNSLEHKESTQGYRTTIAANRALNISQAVNGGCDAILAVLDRIIEDSDIMINFCDWVAQLAVERQTAPQG